MTHTPGPRCTKCVWIHEADSTAGTSFQGVGLCPVHANAPALLALLQDAAKMFGELTGENLSVYARTFSALASAAIAQATGEEA